MRSLSISTHRFNRRKSTPNNHQHHGRNKSYSRPMVFSSVEANAIEGRSRWRQDKQPTGVPLRSSRNFRQRCSELDDYDGETDSYSHSAQFLAQPDLAQLSDDKLQSQIQNLVLRYLSLLLGYGSTERAFCLTPQKLATFSYRANLLPMTLSLMILCPAPPSKNNGPGGHSWLQCHGQAGECPSQLTDL